MCDNYNDALVIFYASTKIHWTVDSQYEFLTCLNAHLYFETVTQEKLNSLHLLRDTFFKIGPKDVTKRRPFRHAPHKEGTCGPTLEIGPATKLPILNICRTATTNICKTSPCIDLASIVLIMRAFFQSTFHLDSWLKCRVWVKRNVNKWLHLCVNLADYPKICRDMRYIGKLFHTYHAEHQLLLQPMSTTS